MNKERLKTGLEMMGVAADWAHVLLLTDKTGTTPKAYPRKAGTPGKKPLGM